jgi:hypothetical protein
MSCEPVASVLVGHDPEKDVFMFAQLTASALLRLRRPTRRPHGRQGTRRQARQSNTTWAALMQRGFGFDVLGVRGAAVDYASNACRTPHGNRNWAKSTCA